MQGILLYFKKSIIWYTICGCFDLNTSRLPHAADPCFFFREDDLLACKHQQQKQQRMSTVPNNCQHSPCTDEAVQLISSEVLCYLML